MHIYIYINPQILGELRDCLQFLKAALMYKKKNLKKNNN